MDGMKRLEAYIKDKEHGTIPDQPAPLNKADYSEGLPDQEEIEGEEEA
jgi:hypothetical protein